MASSSVPCAIILLGNSGVGKSFLANRILNDDEAFESRFSARSVTHKTEWKEYVSSNESTEYLVANVPGLVEANQKLIDENCIEIMKAFEQHPLAIVLFVFGHKNGRIPDEDVVTFTRINDAYEFPSKSLAIIVNGIPLDRPDGYEEKTRQLLQKITHVVDNRIYFIEKATTDRDKMIIHQQLHDAIRKCEPVNHKKKHNIELLVQEISRLKSESQQLQNQLLPREQNYLHRQKLEPATVVNQGFDQSYIVTNEEIPEYIEKYKKNEKSIETTQASSTLRMVTYDEQQSKLNHETMTKSEISHMQTSSPEVIIVKEKSQTRIPETEKYETKYKPHYNIEIVNSFEPFNGNNLFNDQYYDSVIANYYDSVSSSNKSSYF